MGGYISYYSSSSINKSNHHQITGNRLSNNSRKFSSIEEDPECPETTEMGFRRFSRSSSSSKYEDKKRKESTTLSGIDYLISTEQLCATVKEYELDFDHLEIGQKCPSNELDNGTFGRIIRYGTFHNLYFTPEPSAVIVKQSTATASSGNDEYSWKSFLQEINILTWIGWHEHIVTFLGISVCDVHKRQLYMICEYSKSGNLRDYLRFHFKKKQKSVQMTEFNSSSLKNHSDSPQGDEFLLLVRWISQICNAMEFLASRRVVLVELTASSIHLNENLTAKLGNFTLARSLKSDEDYFILSDQVPLPWRWLAPESFEQFKFSTETDMWAFGIVVWEIFSYGQQPYAGFHWTPSFVENLKDGLRPARLSNMPISLYEFMGSCWEIWPESRPSFGNSAEVISTLLEQ